MQFKVVHSDRHTSARTGRLTFEDLPCEPTVETPLFSPVGTLATVKGITPDMLDSLGAQLILANAYHLHLQPGEETVESAGGLHEFMHWHKPILTDSGGFQVFSLSSLVHLTDDGVDFRSHIDGSLHHIGPREATRIQQRLGADIITCFDECNKYPVTESEAARSLARTLDWAQICRQTHTETTQALFGIVQGNVYPDLRQQAIERLLEIGFDGYAIGGLSVGEPKPDTLSVIELCCRRLPESKPRYLMGMGTPADIVAAVSMGVDMFDCVLPTRNGRNGQLFTPTGPLRILAAEHRNNFEPPDPDCDCYLCRKFSKAYLRHLFKADELLAPVLATIHNLRFYHRLMEAIRAAIRNSTFPDSVLAVFPAAAEATSL